MSCPLTIDPVPVPKIEGGFCDSTYTISRADKPSNAVRIVTKAFGYFIDPIVGIPVYIPPNMTTLPPQAESGCLGFDWEDPAAKKDRWAINMKDPRESEDNFVPPIVTKWPFCGSRFHLTKKSTTKSLLAPELNSLDVTIAGFDYWENPTIGISTEACKKLNCNPVCDPWSRCVVELEPIREFDDDIGEVKAGVVGEDQLPLDVYSDGNRTEAIVRIYPWLFDQCHGVGCGLSEIECGDHSRPCPVAVGSDVMLPDQNGDNFSIQNGDFFTIMPLEESQSTDIVIFAMVVGLM
eukprot:GHVP01056987.1.p1 GENE.GHVP01056987.1~~GHVP01056987.1.p1  ORF type:complete len:293 (+),score=52.94 GHVP01056987.1:651-1529(+)